jgi:hypothetical protein
MQGASSKISRLLGRINIGTVPIPAKTNAHLLKSVTDDLGLKVPGTYSIPCECDKVYIRQMGCTIQTRCKEQEWYLRLYQLDKLVVAKHSIKEGHRINFKDTRALARTMDFMDQIMKEATEIYLHPKNFITDMGFNLNQFWNPVTNILWQSKTLSNN